MSGEQPPTLLLPRSSTLTNKLQNERCVAVPILGQFILPKYHASTHFGELLPRFGTLAMFPSGRGEGLYKPSKKVSASGRGERLRFSDVLVYQNCQERILTLLL